MTKQKELPSQEYLKECFTYDPETGLFHWKQRPLSHFKNETVRSRWNGKHSSKLALNSPSADGYLKGRLDGVLIRAHRVAWKLIHGTEPELIMHSKGNKSDNRIEKLSSGNHSKNFKDQKKYKSNSSGVMGVEWYKSRNKWRARITIDREKKDLGYYDDFFEACCVRKSAEVRHEFHTDHGKR